MIEHSWQDFLQLVAKQIRNGINVEELSKEYGGRTIKWIGSVARVNFDKDAPGVSIDLDEVVVDLGGGRTSILNGLYSSISSEYIPEDPKRTLYKWVFNPHWRTEYDIIDATESIQERFMIPVSELRVVQTITQPQKEIKLPDLDLGPMDEPFNMLTIRDLAAIMLKKPVSNKQWLNEIIKSK